MSLKTTNIKKGINFHQIYTNKFKTTTLGIYVHLELNKKNATKNALLSMVLRRGCPMYPTSRSLAEALDNLYGAAFETNIRKKGDSQILSVNFSFVNEKFIDSKVEISREILDMAKSIFLDQQQFGDDIVRQEKENLKLEILGQKNDKRSYALKRCVEEMCKNEPYGIARLGFYEDIDAITPKELYEHYKNVILKSPVDIFVSGDVDFDSYKKAVSDMFSGIEIEKAEYPRNSIIKSVNEVKNIVETEKIVQGKLSMGFRTKLDANDHRYPVLMMYNAVLGSGLFSKLFNNVREKLSLAYYASSSADYLKGIMTINSGIEVSNFKLCYDEIMVQMQDMREGNISDQEYTAAKLGSINSIKSLSDNAFMLEDYYLSRLITGSIIDLDELAEMVEAVTVPQIKEVAELIELDTVYFLKGSEV